MLAFIVGIGEIVKAGLRKEENVRTFNRLPSYVILELLDDLKDDLQPNSKRSHAILAITKLLSMLDFLASGPFQRMVAQSATICQASF